MGSNVYLDYKHFQKYSTTSGKKMYSVWNLYVTIKGCALAFLLNITPSACDSTHSSKYNSALQHPESLIWIIHGTRSTIECSTHCETDRFCVAFSLNDSSCHGYSGFHVNTVDPLVTKHKFEYIRKDACTRGGFMSYPVHRLCIRYYASQRQNREGVKETCRLAGGRLMRVDTREKHEFIRNFLINDVAAVSGVHVDGEAVVKGVWKYADGSTMTYTKWVPGQPDDDTLPACSKLQKNKDFDFIDVPCEQDMDFICEKMIFY